MDGPPEYFLCYSRVQRDLAEKVEAKLNARVRRNELSLWRDVRGIDVWDQFTPEIMVVLGRVAGVIVIVSDDWYASNYVQTYEWPTAPASPPPAPTGPSASGTRPPALSG